MRRTMMLVAGAALALLVTGGAALDSSINCPNAPDGYCYGTKVGDGMYGDFRVDRIYSFGGAGLMYGDGKGDRMYGSNEAGWGDKMLDQHGEDGMRGNRGDDALYGGNGDDVVDGGRGDDLIQGGYGNDAIYTGFGADQVNAQDGQRNVLTCGSGNDLIYLDFKLNLLRDCGTSRANLPKLSPPKISSPTQARS